MSNLITLTGQIFGRLTVVRLSKQRGNGQAMWLCKCVCGSEVRIRGNSLRNGETISCGCFRKETTSNLNRTHGECGTPIYKSWQNMKERCYNKNKHMDYPRYGGRGIQVCKRWHIFINFYEDMMSSYVEGLTLERKDSDKNYSLENCKWATRKEQANNKRCNLLVTAQGLTLNLTQWSEKTGIAYACLYKRLLNNWDAERMVSQPSRRKKNE